MDTDEQKSLFSYTTKPKSEKFFWIAIWKYLKILIYVSSISTLRNYEHIRKMLYVQECSLYTYWKPLNAKSE